MCAAGLISQDPVLFATTIRENLLYGLANRGTYSSGPVVRSGSPEGSDTAVSMKEVSIDIDTDAAEAKEHASAGISQAALDAACKMANCYDFIHSFPEGYDTMVGERGVRLSGTVNTI